MKKAFKIAKKANIAKKYDNQKTLIWKDVIGELSTKEEDEVRMKEEEIMEEEGAFIKPANKFMFEDEDEQIAFNPSEPVTSFRKMISYNKEDLVSKALQQMNDYILNKLPFVVTEDSFQQLTGCARELRQACVSQQEEKYWDEWFTDISCNHKVFFNHLKGQGLGLIKGSNAAVFRVEQLHNEDL